MTEDLPMIRPSAARGARTLALCHARLAAHRGRLEDQPRRPHPQVAKAERFALAAACLAYLAAMAGAALAAVGLR